MGGLPAPLSRAAGPVDGARTGESLVIGPLAAVGSVDTTGFPSSGTGPVGIPPRMPTGFPCLPQEPGRSLAADAVERSGEVG